MERGKIYGFMAVLATLAVAAIIPVQTLLAASPSSSASLSNIWTAVGSTAVVDEGSIDKYRARFKYIDFKGTETGRIYAYFNIEMADDMWNRLSVVYTDPDGSGTQYSVRVKLYGVKIEGTGLGLHTHVATFNSNGHADVTTSVQQDFVVFSHSWDNTQYAYFIRVDLRRSITTDNVRLNGLQLRYWLT